MCPINPKLYARLASHAERRLNNWAVISEAAATVGIPANPPGRLDDAFETFVSLSFERAFLLEPGEDEFKTAAFYVRLSCSSPLKNRNPVQYTNLSEWGRTKVEGRLRRLVALSKKRTGLFASLSAKNAAGGGLMHSSFWSEPPASPTFPDGLRLLPESVSNFYVLMTPGETEAIRAALRAAPPNTPGRTRLLSAYYSVSRWARQRHHLALHVLSASDGYRPPLPSLRIRTKSQMPYPTFRAYFEARAHKEVGYEDLVMIPILMALYTPAVRQEIVKDLRRFSDAWDARYDLCAAPPKFVRRPLCVSRNPVR